MSTLNGMQVFIMYPTLGCSVCRSNSYSWPWSSELLWKVDSLPVVIRHMRPGFGHEHQYEIQGAATEQELIERARIDGWIISHEGIVCPTCQQEMRRLAHLVPGLTGTDNNPSPDSEKEGKG